MISREQRAGQVRLGKKEAREEDQTSRAASRRFVRSKRCARDMPSYVPLYTKLFGEGAQ